MFGLGRRKASPPLFVAGISLIATGIGWEMPAVWLCGLVVVAVGLVALVPKRRARW